MTRFECAHAALLFWYGEEAPDRRGFWISPPVGRGTLRLNRDVCEARIWEDGWIVVFRRRSRRDAMAAAVDRLIQIRAQALTLAEYERRECGAMPG